MSEHYNEDAISLRVFFDRPAPTTVVLQGPAREAFLRWQEEDSDEAYDALTEALSDQLEDYVAQWFSIAEWEPTDF